jgi:hypothetical protein
MSTLGFVRSLVRSRPASLILSRTAASTAVTAAAGHDDPRIYRSPHRPVDLPPPTRSLYDHLFPTAAAGPARTTTTTTLLAPDLPVFVDSASAVRLTRAELERSSALLGREVLDRLGLVVPATAAASPYSPPPPSPTSTAGPSPAAAESSGADGPTPAASDRLEKPPAAAEPPPTVGLFLANGLAWPVAFLACQRAGLPTALFAASLCVPHFLSPPSLPLPLPSQQLSVGALPVGRAGRGAPSARKLASPESGRAASIRDDQNLNALSPVRASMRSQLRF